MDVILWVIGTAASLVSSLIFWILLLCFGVHPTWFLCFGAVATLATIVGGYIVLRAFNNLAHM